MSSRLIGPKFEEWLIHFDSLCQKHEVDPAKAIRRRHIRRLFLDHPVYHPTHIWKDLLSIKVEKIGKEKT